MVTTAVRRTQAERRASTQTRLLDATIECVAELGYHRTTTAEVARRAGLSRGAQLHHFGTRAELVVQALEHLYVRYDAEFRAAMAGVSGDAADAMEAAIDVLWRLYTSPTFSAWMALSLAATADPELRRRMAELDRDFIAGATATFAEVLPEAAANPGLSIAPLFAFTVLDGLALRHAVVGDEAQVTAILDALKAVSRLVAATANTNREAGL